MLAAEEAQICEKQQTKIFFTLAFIDRHMHTFGGFVLKQEGIFSEYRSFIFWRV